MLEHGGHVPWGLRVLRSVLLLTGLWLPKPGSPHSVRTPALFRVLAVLVAMSFVHQIYEYGIKVLHFGTSKKNFIICVISTSMLIEYINSLFRFCWLMLKREKCIMIVYNMQQFLKHPEFMEHQSKLLDQIGKICFIFLLIPLFGFLFLVCLGGVMIYRVYSLASSLNITIADHNMTEEEHRMAMFVQESNMDMGENEAKIRMAIGNVIQGVTTAWITASDALYLSTVCFVSAQLGLLRSALGPAVSAEVRRQDPLGPAVSAEVRKQGSKSAWWSAEEGIGLESWIRYQQNLARLMEEVNQLWSPSVVSLFAANTCVICFLAYAVAQLSYIVNAQWIFLGIGALCLLPLFQFCYMGHLLKQAGEGVSEAAHRGPWLRASPHLVSGLQLLSLDCRRSFVVRGGPFFTLSLEFFASVVGAVLTYFIVLLQMKPAQE